MRDKEVNSGLTLWFKQGTRPMSLQSLQHVCQELYYYYYSIIIIIIILIIVSSSSCSKRSICKVISITTKNEDKVTH